MIPGGHTCIALAAHPVNWFWHGSIFFLAGEKKKKKALDSQETLPLILSQKMFSNIMLVVFGIFGILYLLMEKLYDRFEVLFA